MKAVLIAFSFALSLAAEAASPAADGSPRFVVNLLDYVAADYGGAVSGGKVTSPSEYQEQIEFTQSAIASLRTLPREPAQAKTVAQLEGQMALLLKRIQAKADASEIAALAQRIKQGVIQVTGLPVAPQRWPNLKQGARIYAQNCTTCHGPAGRGDGPAGKGLDPAPADFHDASMAEKTPFRAYNVIRVGVPGTGMVAWNTLSDQDAWDVAFYVMSMRYGKEPREIQGTSPFLLETLATTTDQELLKEFKGSDEERREQLVALRIASGSDGGGSSLAFARSKLDEALVEYRAGKHDSAKQSSLAAYLEGIEPIEARLRANSPDFVVELEQKMAEVRAAIDARASVGALEASVSAANAKLDEAAKLLSGAPHSAWVSFAISAGIIFREGFEAVLILIALLAVVRASGSRKAAAWVHGGWISALGVGLLAWVFSGWVMSMSGASREMLEAVVALLAVAVLLYMGFWLHSRTELNRWNQFIRTQVKTALEGGNLIGLAAISFMAVFREAFETVLFLRAISLEGGEGSGTAMAAGVFGALVLVFAGAWALLKFSAKLPIRTLFSISSGLMALLAVILAGKGVHALQETGSVSVTALSGAPRLDLLGMFPTFEPVLAQILVIGACAALWAYGRRPLKLAATSAKGTAFET